MSDVTLEDALNLIAKLNNTVYDNAYGDGKTPKKLDVTTLIEETGYPFCLVTDGDSFMIKFLNHQIWSNDNDEREWIGSVEEAVITAPMIELQQIVNNNEEDYEPLEQFIKREVEKIINTIGKMSIEGL